MQRNPQTLYVASIDFDGCVSNEGYLSETSFAVKREIVHNQPLINHITDEIGDRFSAATFLVGSARQSITVDLLCGLRPVGNMWIGSCLQPLINIQEKIASRLPDVSMTFNPYLLADTYGSKKHGFNFKTAQAAYADPTFNSHALDTTLAFMMDRKKSAYSNDLAAAASKFDDFSEWVFDKTKFTILYAQMHKIAFENPDSNITFDFFDDRDDILSALKTLFDSNHELIPANLILRLRQYQGQDVTPYCDIQGSGEINADYENDIINMVKTMPDIKHPESLGVIGIHNSIDACKHLDTKPLQLLNFGLFSQPSDDEVKYLYLEEALQTLPNLFKL